MEQHALVMFAAEERVLARGLDGHADYTRRVHFRLVPGVW